MNTSRPTKIAWSIVAAILLAIGVAMLLDREDTPTPTDTALVSDLVVRPDSHRLTSPPQSKATAETSHRRSQATAEPKPP